MAADLLVLTGRRGAELGADGGDAVTIAAIAGTEADDETTTFVAHARGVLQLVSVPIRLDGDIPDMLGRLTVGLFLDDRLAAELKGLTGSEIAFGAKGRILASTLPAATRAALVPTMATPGIESTTIADEELLALARPLGTYGWLRRCRPDSALTHRTPQVSGYHPNEIGCGHGRDVAPGDPPQLRRGSNDDPTTRRDYDGPA